jgi:hypothetical protein
MWPPVRDSLLFSSPSADTSSSQVTRNQESDVSWWPKQSTFLKSGLYVGYWSAWCEKWFQERLQEIKSGKAKPMDPKQWKAVLKLVSRETKLIMKAIENESVKFIDSLL